MIEPEMLLSLREEMHEERAVAKMERLLNSGPHEYTISFYSNVDLSIEDLAELEDFIRNYIEDVESII